MGCFNQSCVVSRLDIQRGEKCALVPLIANKRNESLNDLCFRLYRPFCLPIFGVYNDYGGLEKIQRDRNVELVEKYFEIPIEKFVECATSRRSLYGGDSQIQEAYGDTTYVITKESLAKAGFKTQSDGTLTHPRIEKIEDALKQEHLAKNQTEAITSDQPKFAQLKWESKALAVSGYYQDTQRYPIGEEAEQFLDTSHSYLVSQKKQLPFSNKEEFIFGIPEDKQDRARLLLKLKDAFIREDVYVQIKGRYAKFIKNKRGTDAKGATQEFLELTKQWQKDVIKYNSAKALGAKSTTKDKIDRMDMYDAAFKPNELWYHPYVDPFKTTRTGEEFLILYGAELNSPAILQQLVDFYHIGAAMIHGNIMLLDTNSIEQHGDIEAQIEILDIFSKIAKKIQKDRY